MEWIWQGHELGTDRWLIWHAGHRYGEGKSGFRLVEQALALGHFLLLEILQGFRSGLDLLHLNVGYCGRFHLFELLFQQSSVFLLCLNSVGLLHLNVAFGSRGRNLRLCYFTGLLLSCLSRR